MAKIVLVTGGSGFIGSHVVDRLAAAGYRPRIFDARPSHWHPAADCVIGDIRRLEDVRRALRGCDAVCHLAAAADVGEVHSQPAWATELNTTGTLNVLEAARELGVKRVVYASTVWVYSDVEADVVDEDTPLQPPAHLYTASKLSGELFCRSYAELYGIEPTIVRFGIPYGPRARPAAVIPQFVDKAVNGRPLTIAGSGEQERSFVYVEDLAEGVVRALRSEQAVGRTYNLGGTETTTIRGLAEIVRDEVAATEIVHTEGRSGDLRGARIDSERAARELGWRATTPLREGIRRYAQWLAAEDAAGSQAPVPLTVAPRRTSTLSTVARNPVLVGAMAQTAVASACATVIVGANEEVWTLDFTLVAIALMLPLWALSTAAWPSERRLLQSGLTVISAVLAIFFVGLLSAWTGDSGMPHGSVVLALTASLAVTSILRLGSRRLWPAHSAR